MISGIATEIYKDIRESIVKKTPRVKGRNRECLPSVR